MSVKTTGDGLTGFQFFEVIAPHLADPSVTLVTGATVDRLGYETVTFAIQHSAIGSGAGGLILASYSDGPHLYMEHASNSTTGINNTGAWSAVSAEHVFGVDLYRLMSELTVDSWLLLDNTTRASYPISVPVTNWASISTSGMIMNMAISTTSAASCLTVSYMPTVGYKGPKRWVRILISGSADVSLMPVAANAFLGTPGNWPATMIR